MRKSVARLDMEAGEDRKHLVGNRLYGGEGPVNRRQKTAAWGLFSTSFPPHPNIDRNGVIRVSPSV
jgi:hypothetical protein